MVCQFHVKVDKPGDLFIHRTAEASNASAFKIGETPVCMSFILLYALQRSTVRLSETLGKQRVAKNQTTHFYISYNIGMYFHD